MPAAEGVRRLRLIGKRTSYFGTAAAVAIWLLVYVGRYLRGESIAIGELPLLIAPPLALGGVFYLVAWIVEGFTG
jgi:hypothetical protein